MYSSDVKNTSPRRLNKTTSLWQKPPRTCEKCTTIVGRLLSVFLNFSKKTHKTLCSIRWSIVTEIQFTNLSCTSSCQTCFKLGRNQCIYVHISMQLSASRLLYYLTLKKRTQSVLYFPFSKKKQKTFNVVGSTSNSAGTLTFMSICKCDCPRVVYFLLDFKKKNPKCPLFSLFKKEKKNI